MTGMDDWRPTYREILEQHHLSPAAVAQKAEIASKHSQVLYEGEPVQAFYADALLWAVSELAGERYTRETVRVEVNEADENPKSFLRNKLWWSATARGWVTRTDQAVLFVSEKAYDQHLNAFLQRHGIERKTWSEYMRPAEAAWQRQCEAESILQSNMEYWCTCNEPGVQVCRCK
jgi:hypothetical protein